MADLPGSLISCLTASRPATLYRRDQGLVSTSSVLVTNPKALLHPLRGPAQRPCLAEQLIRIASDFRRQTLHGTNHKILVDDEASFIERPEQALELFRADPHALNLIITDQTTPNCISLSFAKSFLSCVPICRSFSPPVAVKQYDPKRYEKRGSGSFR